MKLRSMKHLLRRSWHILRHEGLRSLWQKMCRRFKPKQPLGQWLQNFLPNPDQLLYLRERFWSKDAPQFSILIPIHQTQKPEYLHQAIVSVLEQTYPHWKLIALFDSSIDEQVQAVWNALASFTSRIEPLESNSFQRCDTDHVLPLSPNDRLEAHALHRLATSILESNSDIYFADHAITSENLDDIREITTHGAFSWDAYLCCPLTLRSMVFRREVLEKGDLREWPSVETFLRAIERSSTIAYLPDVLSRSRRLSLPLNETVQSSIQNHLHRIGSEGKSHLVDKERSIFDVRFSRKQENRVAILIPTKNKWDFLKTCIDSLEQTIPTNLADIVVLDHESNDPKSKHYLRSIQTKHRVIPYSGPFNFAAINNFGVKTVQGNYSHYLFLNNDTAAIESGWLEHMLGFANRSDVGIVGCTLLYPDDTIQHAGVVLGFRGPAGHPYRMMPRRHPGYCNQLLCNRDYSAVTAACCLIRSDIFEEVGGFNEGYQIAWNDIDLCLRVRKAGYKVLIDHQVVLYHFESQSRGTEGKHPEDNERFGCEYRDFILQGDPFFSPLLSLISDEVQLSSFAKSSENLRPITTKISLPSQKAESKRRVA